MITLEINGVDQTDRIVAGTLRKVDVLNEKKDSLKFDIRSHAGDPYVPEIGTEVELFNGATKIFGGVIIRAKESLEGDTILYYEVECTDYSFYLNRSLVVERYEGMTVDDIIAALVADYTSDGFTDTNVNCPVLVTTITFDRITVTEALEKLSQLTNYSWYVDYDMDIHFFDKNSEAAPFNLDDSAGNYIPASLEIERDLSQLRNRVFIRGGEVEGTTRTEEFNGDGVKLTFVLGNKFASKPTVTVGGVSKTVGIDYLDDEASFDCFWSFQEKYVRFKVSTVPASGTNNVDVTGIPLFTLVMRVEDGGSIAQYGVYEFAKTDRRIKSREEAKQFAVAELTAYANSLLEGSFHTYTDGLRSGQVINISSVMRDFDEDFLIQRVTFMMVSPSLYEYTVELATLRSVGIIDFLIGLLRGGAAIAGDASTELLEKVLFFNEEIVIGESVVSSKVHNPQTEGVAVGESTTVQAINYAVEFVAGPYTPSSTKRVFVADGSRVG